MKKHRIAILGFGVVGSGTADLITANREEIKNYTGYDIEIASILDLRDFPASPFASLITHDFSKIAEDDTIDTVIEVMGGSHPAYEYTMMSLKSKKNVITSNKEVVAVYGDEFVRAADENGVSYRFEAAVGGGIPVINPLLSCIRQNKITEIRGILNGTTNYILTKMLKDGESFDSALEDAQARGYAEANPAADVEGIDASRKITILTALAIDKLYDVKTVHTEGITGIRGADVIAAEKLGASIKLLGRSIKQDDGDIIMVAPFMIDNSSPLASVSGVYNAIEVIAEPLGNVMFYGQGAGAGATASAVVGDLIPILTYGSRSPIVPGFNRVTDPANSAFKSFRSRKYIALPEECREKALSLFDNARVIDSCGEFTFVTDMLTEDETDGKLSELGVKPLSLIRMI